MPRSLPQYPDDLAGFAGILRKYLGLSQRKLANYLNLDHSTIARYENETIKPPVGYLAYLVRLVLQQHQRTTTQQVEEAPSFLLHEINKAIEHNYLDEPDFQSWDELDRIADEYLAERQDSHEAADPVDTDLIQTQHLPAIADMKVTPAEVPPLPHFFIERKAIQTDLLEKIKSEKVQTLVLWGQGGAGKTTLTIWLAQTLAADFPGGQIWIELSADLRPDDIIHEVQAQIARRFGVRLNSTSLVERAGQLRTLLQDKQCLLVLDDVWQTSDLAHLRVLNQKSCLLITTRYRKVADVLEVPFIEVGGMTIEECLTLMTQWAGYTIKTAELVNRLGGLPVALKLSGVQLRDGDTPGELLTYFQTQKVDLNRLALDNPREVKESLSHCFDRSFNNLTAQEQIYFAQLGCFTDKFDAAVCAGVWGLSLAEATRQLKRFDNLALVERSVDHYRLHLLLRDYARQKLSTLSNQSLITYRRHAAYYIWHYLYHPQVLDDVTDEAPSLDEIWGDAVAGVKWVVQNVPQLATIAALLAHTERPALLEAVGSSLTTAVEQHLSQIIHSETEQAMLHELLGDLYVLGDNVKAALAHFDQAAILWQSHKQDLAGSRAKLRLAGIHLLREDKIGTIEALAQAQAILANALPIAKPDLETARWLFYWFDLIYTICVKWGDLRLLEEPATEFVALSQRTEEPHLEARGWHIYQLLHTAPEIARPEADRQKGRQFAARAAWLWWQHGDKDKALAEVMWAQERTKQRRSHRMAEQFARRLSRATPKLSQEQIKLIPNSRIHEWLTMNENERVAWLVNELPPPGEDAWASLDDILGIGTMGEQVRRLARGLPYPGDHVVSEPLWKILTGQRPMPLVGETAVALVKRYLTILETELS